MDYQKLNEHIGHDIVIVSYGKNKESISIECETCNEVIASYDKPLKIKGNTKSKSGLSAIVNMNFEIKTPFKTVKKAEEFAENYELPSGYVEDSFEIVKYIDENGLEFN